MSKKCVKPQLRFAGFEEDWEWRKIREICKYCSSNLSVLDIDVDGKYQLYDANGVIGKTNKLLQKEEYITIIKDGSGVGRVRKNLAYSSFIGTMGAIVPNDSEINYLFAEFQRKDFSKHINGATIPHIYFSNYGEDILCIPNVKEQQKIGVYFCNLDKLITLYQNKYDKLTNIKKSMLEKMFPKNGSNVPEIRFKGFSDTWERRKFNEVFDCTIPNNTLPRSELNYESGSVKNIHYGDILIKYGTIIDVQNDEIPFVIGKNSDDFKGALLQDGDIIIADTAEDDTTGKACEINNSQGLDVVSGLHTMVCRPRNKMALGYIGYYINSDAYHYQLLPLMQGIKVLSLSKTNIQKTMVSYPTNMAEQQQIADYFRNLDKLITLHQCKLEKLKNIKKACMEKMFV